MTQDNQENPNTVTPKDIAQKIAVLIGVSEFEVKEDPMREVLYIAIKNVNKLNDKQINQIQDILEDFESDFEEIILTELR